MTRRRRAGITTGLALFGLLLSELLAPTVASAIPAFSRRYETSCTTCHQYHYPRLNTYGRRFRENGYQLPTGAEDHARALRMIEPGPPNERLSVFKELPLSIRGQVFSVVRPFMDSETMPAYNNTLFSFLIGGGTVAKDVSYFFTWTPFPDASIHQARMGLHNIARETLGEGALNVRAGALFLLDFQRPGHRFMSAGASSATSVSVGQNHMTFDEATLGVQFYGRPNWGPFHYELAIVSGDVGDTTTDRDRWKDVFARLSYTFFHNTAKELRVGSFGYLGRSEMINNFGGVELAQRDNFYMVGGDVELDIGKLNLSAMGYKAHHGDPLPTGGTVDFWAGRATALWSLSKRLMVSARMEVVVSKDLPSLDRTELAPHLTYQLATNSLLTLVWRHDLKNNDASSAVLVLDAAF